MRLTRADQSVLSDWWFTVDRLMFFGLLLLMGAGLCCRSPRARRSRRNTICEPFYFVRRQAALLSARCRHHVCGLDADAEADQACRAW